jgi:hypothetical protein
MSPSGRKWPNDPNYWLLVGICLYGALVVGSLTLTLLRLLSPHSTVHVVILLIIPSVGFAWVLYLQFASHTIRFHSVMLIGCLMIIALSLLVYLQLAGIF